MADEETHVTFSSSDYDAIEAAVMETSRGRWFLREFAKRNRNADTVAVLAAVDGLKEVVLEDRTARTVGRIRADLRDMASAIRQTKNEFDGPIPDEASAEERIRRIVQTLHYLEGRIHAMIAICDPEDAVADEAPAPDRLGFEDKAVPHRSTVHPAFLM